MLKKFWDFIKRIFGKKKQALPEATTDFSSSLASAISADENFASTTQFLENNDELILTIHTNENDEKNVNIQVLRNGEEINKEESEFDKEKVVDYLKNIKIDEDEIIDENVEHFETENIEVTEREIVETKIIEEPLNFETDHLEINENITNLIDFESEEKVVVAEAEEVAGKISEANTVEVIESNVIEFPKKYVEETKVEEATLIDTTDENMMSIINYIKILGFTDEEISDLIKKNSDIVKVESDIVVDNLNYLTNAGLKNSHLYSMIKEKPELLTNENVKEIDEKISILKEKTIESSDVYSLYIHNPDILLLETRQIEQSLKVIKKFYRTKERIQYIMKYFPHAIGMTDLNEIRRCVEKI